MATQTVTLTQPYGNRSAVLCTLARQRAVNAVKEQLRAQGLKLAQFSSRDIHIWADAFLEAHRRELIEQAMEMVSKSQGLRKLYEREQRHRAKLESDAQTQKRPISTTSAVQMSGAQ